MFTFMRFAAAVALVGLLDFSPRPAAFAAVPARLSAADRSQIRQVIALQNKAFARDDEALAFSYSTPEVRKRFGTARGFMAMVRAEYSALYRNISANFLEAAVIDGEVIQPLQIVTHDGQTLVALYSLQRQADKRWRIGGCTLAPSSLLDT